MQACCNSHLRSAAVAYRSSMARRASPGYNRVAGTNAIGSDTQEDGVTLLTRNTVPAVEVGGTLEHYSGPVVLRFDLGELIVPYGNASLASFSPQLPPPGRLGTQASPIVGLGFAVRF